MTLFKDWLLGVTAAAMLLAMAEGLTPKGTVRQIGKLTGGLVLMVAVLQPILKIDYGAMSGALSRFRDDLGIYEAEPAEENFQLMKSIIEARSAAYIQDKAADLGIQCQAEIICTAGSTEEYPYPAAVIVEGRLTQEQINRLRTLIEGDLAIPVKDQTYRQEGGEAP